MIIHIGDNISILEENILIILDKNTVEKSDEATKFIEGLINNGALVNKLHNDIKSYIITTERDKKNKIIYKLYISNISSKSLSNRKITLDDWR